MTDHGNMTEGDRNRAFNQYIDNTEAFAHFRFVRTARFVLIVAMIISLIGGMWASTLCLLVPTVLVHLYLTWLLTRD